MSEYVEPVVLSDEEHEHHAHLCGFTPAQGLNCDECPAEIQVRCMREHTLQSCVALIMMNGCTEEEALRSYWEFIPTFIAIKEAAKH